MRVRSQTREIEPELHLLRDRRASVVNQGVRKRVVGKRAEVGQFTDRKAMPLLSDFAQDVLGFELAG